MTNNRQHDKGHATVMAALAALIVAIFLGIIYKVVKNRGD